MRPAPVNRADAGVPPPKALALLVWAWESGFLKAAQVFLMFSQVQDPCLRASSKVRKGARGAFIHLVDQPRLCLMVSDLFFNLPANSMCFSLGETLPVFNLWQEHHFSSFSKTLPGGMVTDKTGNTAQPIRPVT